MFSFVFEKLAWEFFPRHNLSCTYSCHEGFSESMTGRPMISSWLIVYCLLNIDLSNLCFARLFLLELYRQSFLSMKINTYPGIKHLKCSMFQLVRRFFCKAVLHVNVNVKLLAPGAEADDPDSCRSHQKSCFTAFTNPLVLPAETSRRRYGVQPLRIWISCAPKSTYRFSDQVDLYSKFWDAGIYQNKTLNLPSSTISRADINWQSNSDETTWSTQWNGHMTLLPPWIRRWPRGRTKRLEQLYFKCLFPLGGNLEILKTNRFQCPLSSQWSLRKHA